MNLDTLRSLELNLDALAELAGRLLREGGVHSADDRVNPAPDLRTLRYYQTLGLLDRPLRYEGRVAMYGFRHLLQVLVVKILQARGLSLAQAQSTLLGATDSALESAVREALGGDDAAQQAAPSPPPPAVQEQRCVRLAPGVTLILDPALVSDPDALIRQFAQVLRDLPLLPQE